MTTSPLGETAAVFESLAAVVYSGQDVPTVLQRIVDAAVELIPGADHATVAMIIKGEFTTVVASDDIIDRMPQKESIGTACARLGLRLWSCEELIEWVQSVELDDPA